MKNSSVARKATAIVMGVAAATGAMSSAYAQQQNSIFPTGWDSKVRDRLFMRLGYTNAFIKTKSEEARDITGPVITRQDLVDAGTTGAAISAACEGGGGGLTPTYEECVMFDDALGGYAFGDGGVGLLIQEMDKEGLTGLGTPRGIKVKSQKSAGTPTISFGYWLDEERKWLLEAFVLAAPLRVKIYGDGVRDDGSPNTLNGRHVATTKLLPPLVVGSYNFGDRRSIVRPYIGVGAMYAIFFDTKSTEFFDAYQGGKTTITTKNAFGIGPFVGLQSPIDDDWHVNMSVGQISLRTTATLVTSGSEIKSGSAVLSDFSTGVKHWIDVGENLWTENRFDRPNEFTTTVMNLVKRNRGASDLGTYVREQKMKITNTIVTLSVGRSF